jgi:RHS repeat-associated protein
MRDYGQQSENFQGRMFHMMDTYDAANRLTSVGGVVYAWDANGNLTSDGVRSYSYSPANRLTEVTQGSVTTQYAYNGDGVRTSKTVAGDTTEYGLDLLATLPVVISDTDAVYLYGLDIIAQQQAERLYYLHDGLGSVRQLVDTTGQIETNYAYDPFGVPVVEGDESKPYQYTGEAWDAEVELLYLRARYYQPETGRFMTKDPWAGNLWSPGALNPYSYVSCNPINRTDWSGLQCEGPACPCPIPTPTAVSPECVTVASVVPVVSHGIWAGGAGPTPVPLPYPTWQTPTPQSVSTAPAGAPQPTWQTPSACSLPTAPVVPTPVAASTWMATPEPQVFWTRSGAWRWVPGEGPQPVGVQSICPENPPLVGSRQMDGLADQIEAFASGAERSGLAEGIGAIATYLSGRPDIGRSVTQWIIVAPDLASAWFRRSADYYRKCGY